MSVTEATRVLTSTGAVARADALTITYNRRPGIYFTPFTLTMTATLRWNVSAMGGGRNVGIWKIPYNQAPAVPDTGISANSTNMTSFLNAPTGTVRTASRTITDNACFTGGGGSGGTNSGGVASINANYKYWYRIYPGDGSVAASSTSGSIFGGAKTVTFSTPAACSWPTYYDGTNSYNGMKTGSLWPDVLVSYSTTGWPSDPTYNSHNVRATYNSSTQKTTASVNLPAGQTYYVKARLAVDNGYSDRQDVEYSTVNSFVYYTYAAPTASPAAGAYILPQNVSLSGAAGTTIRYTTDGSNPTASSLVYSAPITVQNTTIKAQLYSGSTPVSPVASYGYTLSIPAVTASPAAGTLYNTQDISLSCADGYELYYSVDGTTPTKETGTKYTAPIQLTESTNLRVQRYLGGEPVGSMADFNYTINLPGVKADPSPGAVGKGTKVALLPTAGDAAKNDIYYTEHDSVPYASWTLYTSPIEITKDTTLYAVARDKISGQYGEKAIFAYQYSELGYLLNDLSFWDGSTKVTSTDIAALAGKTFTAKANITKIIPSIQGWLVTALYDPSGHAQAVKLDKLDQISGIASGIVAGKSITLPSDTTNCVLKTFIVHDFAQLRPVGAVVQIGERAE